MAWIAEHTKTILSLHKTHDWRVLFSRFRFEAQKLWRTTEDVVEAMQDFPGFIMAAWTPPSSEKEWAARSTPALPMLRQPVLLCLDYQTKQICWATRGWPLLKKLVHLDHFNACFDHLHFLKDCKNDLKNRVPPRFGLNQDQNLKSSCTTFFLY